MDHGQIGDPHDIERMLNGYRLATAEILYHMPDNLDLLQIFVWQDYDLIPDFPVLNTFLNFWHDHLDGPLHSVRVASAALLTPAEFSAVDGVIRIH